MSEDFGQEEGAVCWRNGCQGIIAVVASENCSCHIAPPCGSCTTPREHCPVCDWRAQDDEKVTFRSPGGGIAEMLIGPQPRPLDARKIDYRIHAHSGASQICEGVYPEGTDRAEVEAIVRGTFGGHFEHFRGGKFKYIAYTD